MPTIVESRVSSRLKCGPSHWRRDRIRSANWIKAPSAREELLASVTAPFRNGDLEKAIEASSYIGGLPDDWDESGSSAISVETWKRAVSFLRASAERFSKECGARIDVPQISPGPAGSVDIHWQNRQFMLLINIRPSGLSDFYGETPDGLTIKGTFLPETHHQGILSWLKQETTR